jgi:hypothetical protein
MMPKHHGWGLYTPQTTSYIHIRHIQRAWAISMLSQGLIVAQLYRYTSQVGPHLSIQVHLSSDNNATPSWWGWYPFQTTSNIHIRHIQSAWAIDMLTQGHIDAPLYRYTSQVGPRLGDLGSLEEWKWCHNVMVDADIDLWLFHTYILDIYKVFEPLVCCLKGILLHPYTLTLAKLAKIWEVMITCGVKMMLRPCQRYIFVFWGFGGKLLQKLQSKYKILANPRIPT